MSAGLDPLDWLTSALACREARIPSVLVTVVSVEGHSPRNVGAKMLVTPEELSGSIGGGNLEAMAIDRARRMLDGMADGCVTPLETWSDHLSEHVRGADRHGRQCCGGRVTLLFEPAAPRPSVAVVGMGHVGHELALLLARHPVELHLVDSRPERLTADVLAAITGRADVQAHRELLPEAALSRVPNGTHVLVMTHDHAEDMAVLDAVLRRREHFADVGVIGSSAKWRRFRKNLLAQGHSPENVDSISCPIGSPAIQGKEPEMVALSVAAALIPRLRPVVQSPQKTTHTRLRVVDRERCTP